ncbi:putative methyltransferase DDB_G0268948 [Ciona intestinalis]
MIKLFESVKHTSKYAEARPTTPGSVAERIISFMSKSKPLEGSRYGKMVDVGCGNGQSTSIFAPYFKSVVGMDTSENQIAFAKKKNNIDHIEYLVGNGESLPFKDAELDLVASGQAVHWMDLDKFLPECRRVLKPGGCILLHGYKDPEVQMVGMEEDEVQRTKEDVKNLKRKMHDQCRFNPRIKHVDDGYLEISDVLKSDDKVREDGKIIIERYWTLEELEAYFHSWSGYQTYIEDKKKELMEKYGNIDALEEHDIMKWYVDGVKKVWNVETKNNSEIQLHVTFDVFMILSGIPKN